MIRCDTYGEAFAVFSGKFMDKDNPWEYDREASDNAGYPVYRDPKQFYNYMCNLGDRLEINLYDGNETFNIWYGRGEDKKPTLNLTDEEIKHLPKILFDYMNARIQTDSDIYDKHIQMCKSIMDKAYEIAKEL